ncbi:NADP-dependent oxidoreductase [Nocardia sp. NPDC058497]|uniref:NADP-dependent oxidoreductase n=1 Tax=Nocardia sp. NPDC058497 TaxID=3346529 RepID=UPI0036464C48
MKAIFYRSYGDADVMEYGDLPEPKLGPSSVLVRVKAAAVNPLDWKAREGLYDGFMDTVFPVVPGIDFSGVVERVGFGVRDLAPGDEVMGCVPNDEYLSRGTVAELTSAPARCVIRKPSFLNWIEAAALPLVGLSAYQGMNHLAVRDGEVVLVHGAAGGVGSMAVQYAVKLGARVIGTASEHNHDFLRSLGAEPVDYRRGLAESVAALAPGGVDAVLDASGKRTLRTVAPLLKEGGRLASVADPGVRSAGGTYVFAQAISDDIQKMVALAEEGTMHAPISAVYPLENAVEAFRESQAGHARGKIVVAVGCAPSGM